MESLRQSLRRLAKAVTVITTADESQRYAMTATAVSELSFDPPSMLICVNRSASLYPLLSIGAPFVINILHSSQSSLASLCAGAAKGEARFVEGDWVETELGVPRLKGAQARIMGEKEDAVRSLGFKQLAIFRPGIIAGNVHTPGYLALLGRLVPGSFGTIDQDDIGRAMVREFLDGQAGTTILENAVMKQRAREL